MIDIETAPHLAAVWGPKNTYISPRNIVQDGHTLCFAAKWHGQKRVMFHSKHHHGEDAMIEAAWELLDKADAVTHWNGKSFDIPTLNTNFIERDMPPPSPFKEIDLLLASRKKFRRYSHKLDEVARRLNLGSKFPHKGLGLWLDCMNGCEKAWATMKKYNVQDIRLLEAVHDKLSRWVVGYPNQALYTDNENPTCGHCKSTDLVKRGVQHTQTQSYHRYYCKQCKTWWRGRYSILPPDRRQSVLAQA